MLPRRWLLTDPLTQTLRRSSAVFSILPGCPRRAPWETRKLVGASPLAVSHCLTDAFMPSHTGLHCADGGHERPHFKHVIGPSEYAPTVRDLSLGGRRRRFRGCVLLAGSSCPRLRRRAIVRQFGGGCRVPASGLGTVLCVAQALLATQSADFPTSLSFDRKS